MTKEYRAKVFKSGNSLALRLPKSMGIAEGDNVRIVPHSDGTFSIWRVADDASILDSLYGSMSPGFMSEGRGDTEQQDRSWDRDSTQSAA